MQNRPHFNKKGFTLIELLVVIAIIGILSSIGLVALNGAREKARDAQRVSDLAQMRTALALYYDSNNSKYPGEIATLDAASGSCVGNNGWTYLANGATFADIHGTAAFSANIFTGTTSANFPAAMQVIPTYLGATVLPPTAVGPAINGISLYCYDTNGAAAGDDRSMYFLYTKLESGSGDWYWLNEKGQRSAAGLSTAHASGTCVSNGAAADVCNW